VPKTRPATSAPGLFEIEPGAKAELPAHRSPVELEICPTPARRLRIDQIPLIQNASAPRADHELRTDLSERVATFRRRRAQIRAFDPSSTLELDFGAGGEEGEDGEVASETALSSAEKLESVVVGRADPQDLDSVPLKRERIEKAEQKSAAAPAGRTSVPIVLESSWPSSEPVSALESDLDVVVAPLGQRFLAGLLDALAVILTTVLFLLIFWKAGGHLRLRPVSFEVVGSVMGFFIWLYFGLFSALSSATPGQSFMGLAVRSFDGSLPTPTQSFWRGFGYLISVAAFLLGFVWALVDSDGLTWHDRMSGTFLAAGD